MANPAIGFDLEISKDFGIMTHRQESLWVDDIEGREGFSQRLIPLSIRRLTRLIHELDRTHMLQETRNSIKHTIYNSINT